MARPLRRRFLYYSHTIDPTKAPAPSPFWAMFYRLMLVRGPTEPRHARNSTPCLISLIKPRLFSWVGVLGCCCRGRLVGSCRSVARNGAFRGRSGVHVGSQRLGPGENTETPRERGSPRILYAPAALLSAAASETVPGCLFSFARLESRSRSEIQPAVSLFLLLANPGKL